MAYNLPTMASSPPSPTYYLRQPTTAPSSTKVSTFLDGLSKGAENVVDYMKSLRPETVYTVAGLAITAGVGGAALYFRRRGGSDDTNTDPPPLGKCPAKSSLRSKSRVEFSDGVGSETRLNNNRSRSRMTIHSGDDGTALTSATAQIRDNILVLKQCPRGRKTPCIAPFPLKLETFLRVHGIEYELDFNGHEPKQYGSPWIRLNTEDISDSQNVVRYLIDQYEIGVEKGLSGEQHAMAIAYTHLLENHLYWGIALWRWVYDGARSLKDIQLLPKKTQQLIPDVCRTVEQAAWFHGIGKMPPEEVKKAVIEDLRSLSEFLGSKDYLLGTSVPTELDCTAFGMLAQFLWNMKGPFHDAIAERFQNLRDFCWRIRLKYWPDWEDCLNNTEFFSNEAYPVADAINYPF